MGGDQAGLEVVRDALGVEVEEEHAVAVGGRIVALEGSPADARATGQFDIADERSPSEVAAVVQRLGYEPVWKDWDSVILETLTPP